MRSSIQAVQVAGSSLIAPKVRRGLVVTPRNRLVCGGESGLKSRSSQASHLPRVGGFGDHAPSPAVVHQRGGVPPQLGPGLNLLESFEYAGSGHECRLVCSGAVREPTGPGAEMQRRRSAVCLPSIRINVKHPGRRRIAAGAGRRRSGGALQEGAHGGQKAGLVVHVDPVARRGDRTRCVRGNSRCTAVATWAGSRPESARVRLLSRAHKRQAPAMRRGPAREPRANFSGRESTAHPRTTSAIPRATRPSNPSRKNSQARSAVKTTSRFNRRDAADAWVTPSTGHEEDRRQHPAAADGTREVSPVPLSKRRFAYAAGRGKPSRQRPDHEPEPRAEIEEARRPQGVRFREKELAQRRASTEERGGRECRHHGLCR